MKTLAIAGGSGLVGSKALELLLGNEEVGRVVALGRRLLPFKHEKLVSRVVDLRDIEAMVSALPEELDAAISALGTTRKKAGSKQAFRAVDLEAVVAFAKASQQKGARRFLLVSSIGADPRSRSFYLRTKGETEQALMQLGFEQLTILRPSLIDDQGARAEFRLGERLALPLARAAFIILGRTRRHAPIGAAAIGQALARLILDETSEALRIVESDRLHILGR